MYIVPIIYSCIHVENTRVYTEILHIYFKYSNTRNIVQYTSLVYTYTLLLAGWSWVGWVGSSNCSTPQALQLNLSELGTLSATSLAS